MAPGVNDVISAQLEQVNPVLVDIFEQSDYISGKVKPATKAQTVSRYIYRMPFKRYNGGDLAKVNANGGAMPPGTAQLQGALYGGYYRSAMGWTLTDEMMDTTASPGQSIVNVLTDTLANAMREAQVMDDITFHQPGNGILTNASSAITNTTNATMTFASATDFLGVNLLREGLCISVWDATGATERAAATAAPIIIQNINYNTRTITLNQEVTTLTETDIVAFRGMAAYGPSTLTTYNSSYPGTPPITGNGIGGDSYRHGFPYMTDPTASNYFYGIQKSTISQLLPVSVNANSTGIEWEMIFRIIAQVQRKRDNDPYKNLMGIAEMAQRTAVMNLGMNITTNMQTTGDFGRSLDQIPDNVGSSDVFNMAGIPCYTSKRQWRDRIDFIDLSKIQRVQLFDTRFKQRGGGGGYIFEDRDTNGNVITSQSFWIEQSYDYVCVDNGTFARIYGLSLPSANYDA